MTAAETTRAPAGRPSLSAVNRHWAVLDAIRGIAILLVVMHHYFQRVDHHNPLFRAGLFFFKGGWSGVDLFFVLSGFLITGILLDSKPAENQPRLPYFRNFYMRRVLRIFPLYYGVLVLVFWVGPMVSRAYAAEHAELLAKQAWFWPYLSNIELARAGWWNLDGPWISLDHFWSLAIEEQFYLAWPALVLLCNRRTLGWMCSGAIMLAIVSRWYFAMRGRMDIEPYVFTFCRVDALALGALAAVLIRSRARGAVGLAAPAAAIIAVASLALWGIGELEQHTLFFDTFGYTLLALAFTSVLLIAVGWESGDRALPSRVLGVPLGRGRVSRGLQFFGRYSYGIYVYHWLIEPTLRVKFPPDVFAPYVHSYGLSVLLRTAVCIAVSVAIAYASWHLYEKLFLKMKRFFPQKAGKAAVDSVPAQPPAVVPTT